VGDALRSATLVYDAGTGLGHRRRVEALAHQLRTGGIRCQLTPTGTSVEDEILIVDSYAARADDPSVFKGVLVAAIDDLERDLAVDLVVDPAPGASAHSHRRAATALVGAAYALVGPDVAALHGDPPADQVRTVLVSTGGDGTHAIELARRLSHVIPPGAVIRVVVGAHHTNEGLPSPLHAIHVPAGLGPELAAADLVVTAGGVTMLEALALGRPAVAMVLHENQRRQTEGAAREGAVVLTDSEQVVDVTAALVGDAAERHRLASRAALLVDGRGAERVAREVARLG
jgi:UDP-2,4-diacetamido-2,4,6-trideoxy-beta-L-altropyranose hydrolase